MRETGGIPGGCRVMGCLVVALMSCLSASCQAKVEGLDSRARADFEWFSSLGFPDVKGCPCVRLENGGSWTANGEPIKIDYIDAFVLATNSGNLALFTTDLSNCSVTNKALPKGRLGSYAFEWVDLRKEADAQVQAIQSRPAKDDPFRHFNRSSEERAEIFLLAWACWRNGMPQEAQRLYDAARKLSARIQGHDQFVSFRGALEKDLGHNAMWRAIRSLGEPSTSRAEVLKQLETILKNYPRSEHRERAEKTAKVLRRMVAEDEVRSRTSPADMTAMSVDDRVQELIYRLRDQNGHQMIFPGRCDIFCEWPGGTNTPAHQLVRLGYAAVPQLIEALNSDTLSRSLGPIRFSDSPDIVLTVGDCAEAILQKITGKSFFVPHDGNNNYMSAAGESLAARKAAKAWWAEFQKKGEKQVLIEAVAAAGHDAPAQAELLCQRYPDVATAAMIRGSKAATNGSVRASLVEQIGKRGESSGMEFLRDELVHGPMLESRVAAAFALRAQGDLTAVSAMMREWQQKPEQTEENEYVWNQVPEFLSGCDSVEAITTLTADVGRRNQKAKYEVVVALGDTNRWSWRHQAQTASPKTLEAIEQALVGVLEDTTECFNTSFFRNDKGLSDPRICDLAAWFLSDRWPGRYSFDFEGTLEARNRQRLQCLNSWRAAHNLAPIAVRERILPTERPKLARTNGAMITSVEWSEDSAEPKEAFVARVAGMKNKRLEAKDFVGVLATFAAHPEPNAMGLDLKAFRDGDLTGVRLVARLIPGRPPTPDGSIGWDVSQHVILAGKSLQGSSGGGRLDAYSAASDWEDLADGIKKALSSPPETPFEIGARIVGAGGTRITRPGR